MSAFDPNFLMTQLLPNVKHLNPKSIKHFFVVKLTILLPSWLGTLALHSFRQK